MPESRGRRPKKSSQPKENSGSKGKPTQKEGKEENTPQSAQRRYRLLNLWKNAWAVLGPTIALTGVSFLLWPQIKIEPSVNPNPTDPVGTEFTVVNSGNVPVYNVRFSCALGIGGGSSYLGRVSTSAATLRPVSILPPGVPVTKSCVLSSEGSQIPNMEATASYEWPLIWKESSKSAFFRVIRGTNGAAYLLPDLPPPRHAH
jgi:hypothetical protein